MHIYNQINWKLFILINEKKTINENSKNKTGKIKRQV